MLKQNIEPETQQFFQTLNHFVAQTPNRTLAANSTTNNSKTILIVDDTPNNLQVLFSYLESKGYKVLLAEDGESALQIAESQPLDLILLDVLMPDLDGFQTCRLLKQKTSTRDVPVIFLTALSETFNKVQGFKLGAVDYITKPIQQEEVSARIETHLNLRTMHRILAAQNRQLKQALDFEALVRRITDKIRDNLDESYSLQIAAQELVSILEISCCQIELYDSDRMTATIAHEYTMTLPKGQGQTRQINDFPEIYQQLLNKNPLQLVETIPQFNPQGVQVTRLACPIFDKQEIMGNLWVLRPPEEVFSLLEIQLMQQVASQCAIAIRQARLYKAANQQVKTLARLNHIKDDFLKHISHKLKAPMSTISLASETLEKILISENNPRESPTFKRVVGIFHESCQRQKVLIDDLLALCYLDTKAKTIQNQLVELNFWLSQRVYLYLRDARNQEQELILNLALEKLYISVDPKILERIVRELVHNVCKHTPAGGIITIQTETRQSSIALCI
ncbi:response regulator, partial [Aetokthonos hydrillicola]